nr:lysoplasmalogenase family protein [Brachybacterium equifaecis]
MLVDAPLLQQVTQSLTLPLLLAAVIAAVPLATRTARLLVAALALCALGDLLPVFTPWPRPAATTLFLLALLVYACALAPLWSRGPDGLRLLLAIPYGAVVVGLLIACLDGAGGLLPLLMAYALALALVAFLAAGVNPLTWVGGTLLLFSSSVLGMAWFLPGAWLPLADIWVMLSYFLGEALMVAGLLRTIPRRRWDAPASDSAGARLIITDSQELIGL